MARMMTLEEVFADMERTGLDRPLRRTRIPEGRAVPGVEYGAHVSGPRWSGYYVRTAHCPQWAIARETPASDELEGDDRDILLALDDELESLQLAHDERVAGAR